jgi:outer membrane receptor protein involved in Fe transport
VRPPSGFAVSNRISANLEQVLVDALRRVPKIPAFADAKALGASRRNRKSLISVNGAGHRERQYDCPAHCMRANLHWIFAGVVLLAMGVSTLAAGEDGGCVRGDVSVVGEDGARSLVPNASVVLHGNNISMQASTDKQGAYAFASVPPGLYELDAQAPGLVGAASVQVKAAGTEDVSIQLEIETMKLSVTVDGVAEQFVDSEPCQKASLDKSTIQNAPTRDDRADALLPLIPGVVRGPDGLINIKGARSSQSGYLVNSASAVDPVTGNAALSLPIDVVEAVTVIANPYDPEYGRLTGAVSTIETATGNFDKFHFSMQNFFVRPRKRDSSFVGIESATPRATFTGPLIRHKVAFTQSLEYRFVRTPVSSLPPLDRDIKFESVTSFSQIDVNLNQRQSMTISLTVYPQKVNYYGLNTFLPQPSTPDVHQTGYMASLQYRDAIGDDSLLVSQFSYKRFNVDVTANSTAPFDLLVETSTGGFWDLQKRESGHTEWHETWQHGVKGLIGAHQLKLGADYAHDDYTGQVDMLPVTIFGTTGLPIEQIQFGPASRFDIHQNQIALFAADRWQPTPRLTFDLGVRMDHDTTTGSTSPAPRVGFALMLTKDQRTVLKGGAGLFYDRVSLNVATFALLPDRTVNLLSSTGEILESQPWLNAFAGPLRNPRSVAWNVELDRQISSALVLRAGFQERNTSRDFVLDQDPSRSILLLSNTGRSFYREFEITGRYKVHRGTLNASYVRSKAFGNLNDFNQFFGNNGVAVIEPDQQGRLPFDAPNRVLTWGEWNAPSRITVLPVLDIHTGFPWSITDQTRDFVGQRDSMRFPRFASVDLQVTRPIALPFHHEKLKARVGFSVFNLLNRFNPRDVQSDIDSARFGALFNGVGRIFRGTFTVEF